MRSLFGNTLGRTIKVIEVLDKAGFGDVVDALLERPELAQLLVEQSKELATTRIPRGQKVNPQVQMRMVREWNESRGWGLSDEVLDEAEAIVPRIERWMDPDGAYWHTFRDSPIILVPRLENIGYTVRELFGVCEGNNQDRLLIPRYFGTGCCLSIGGFKPMSLTWTRLNLTGRFKSPVDCVVEDHKLADVEVLAAMALHPTWREEANGVGVPFPVMGGLRYRHQRGEITFWLFVEDGKVHIKEVPPDIRRENTSVILVEDLPHW